MIWPFRKKKPQPQPEPVKPDFRGALRAVAGQVMLGQQSYVAFQDLRRFGVTEEDLVAWVRSGAGRDVLPLKHWQNLTRAELGELSALAVVMVQELGGEEVKPEPSPPGLEQIKPEAIELFNRGVDSYYAGDLQGAMNCFTQAIHLDPNFADAYNGRGNFYLDLKEYEKAIADYTQAINLDPNLALAYNGRGTVYLDLKEYEKAIADYTQAIHLDPNYALAYNNRGNVYLDLKEYEKALAEYTQAIHLDPNYAPAYYGHGNVYLDLKEYEKALADYTQAINLDPNLAPAYYGRGNVYINLKEYEKAIADYTQAINLDPNYALAYYGHGNVYINLKEYEKAIADYTQAIHLDPNYALAYYGHGNVYCYLKEYEKAIADYTQAIHLDPNLWETWAMRGQALFFHSGYQAALENYTTGLSHLNPDRDPLGCAKLHWFTGRAHFQQGQTQRTPRLYFAQATKSYSQAYQLIEANPLYTPHTLEILRDWIKCDRALGESEAADALTLNAIQRLNQALQSANSQYRRVLRDQFNDFYHLNVDRLISQNQPWQALTEAERWKAIALTWLRDPDTNPQPLSPETLQTRIRQLCPTPHTAILYWHLSPSQITTFLLRPDQDPQTFTTPCDPPYNPDTKTQTNFTEWLKQYKEQYQQHRKHQESQEVPLTKGDLGGFSLTKGDLGGFSLTKGDLGGFSLTKGDLGEVSLTKGDLGGFSLTKGDLGEVSLTKGDLGEVPLTKGDLGEVSLTKGDLGEVPLTKGDLGGFPWPQQLPHHLQTLSQILNLPQLLNSLTDIHTLTLIPHRDLHLLPLHALLPPTIRPSYLPNLTHTPPQKPSPTDH
ncbi:tetratricopeptide repeat protein, partial [Spirulina subsalsa FACHB-351]